VTRLLQAIGGAEHGGAEAFFERLAAALHRAGEDQAILMRQQAPAARLRALGLDVREARFGGPLDLLTRLAFRRRLAALRPRLVLTWMSRATLLCPRGEFVHVARLGGYYDLKRYAACDHLIGNTRDLVESFKRQGWPENRVHYLPNFVDSEAGRPLPRAALATPEGVPLALALGRLHENKGFDTLIAALAQVPGLHLWLAGEGPLRAALERQIAEAGLGGRVRLLGWRRDVADLLASADFLVCPSRHEPLGNVVIEGWAAGLPVLAAASVGPAALIRDGETGFLAPIDDVGPLAAAMDRLARDAALRARLGAAGRAAYEAEFTEAIVVARYRALFDRLAAA
jgi:glycosyltransferase involved in cell wall biosynthesis